MKNKKRLLADILFMLFILALDFILNLLLGFYFETQTLIPMIFVLGVFLISLKTQGYILGITSSLISVVLVNWAFTYPYYEIDLVTPECIVSAVAMLTVAVLTGTLTIKIKNTEKMRAEIEKESMRANLLRAVSHDLRTPLTTIYGSCSAVIENFNHLKKEEHIQLLNEIQEDSEWLIRMVENLLSVTRIDGQKVNIKKLPTVLDELIDTVLIKFKKRCPNQEIEVNIPDDFISIPMDVMLIEQVLINLLENAVYHAKGMTKLWLTVTVENNFAKFTVSDNGCGIDEEILPEIFTGYLDRKNTNIDSTRNNMGIGLSVCATIIRAHDSEIFAKNNKPCGAVFEFTLETEDNQ